MLCVQRWIPALDQIALLCETSSLSVWCGVPHHVSSTVAFGFVPSLVIRDSSPEIVCLTEVQGREVPIWQPLDERIVSAFGFDAGRGCVGQKPVAVGFSGTASPVDMT